MKILEKEIGLREETRSTEQVRDALDVEDYAERASGLAVSQHEIADMAAKTSMAIVDLEKEKNLSFPKELQLMNAVSSIMQETEAILSEPNTGPEAIAAETEIIEMLLQVQRKQPPKKSSKGAAGENPNGGGEGDTEESALALIGRGDEVNAGTVERETAQATGTSGTTYPAEFRAGLDAYFADLEK